MRSRLALTVGATIFAVYLGELALFLLAPTVPSRQSAALRSGITFDNRRRLDVVQDMRARGLDAYPSIDGARFLVSKGVQLEDGPAFPLSGVSLKPTVNCNESGSYAIYHSDEHGFNNPPGSWTRRPEMVLIGDSFAHGDCVGSSDDTAAQLRGRGRRALNLGRPGSGPLIELAILKEFAEPVRPEVVLWVYYEGNDLHDLCSERTSNLLMSYLETDSSRDLIHRQREVDRQLTLYIETELVRLLERESEDSAYQSSGVGEGVAIMKLARMRHELSRWLGRLSDSRVKCYEMTRSRLDTPPDTTSLLRDVLKKASSMSSSWGGRLHFVYLPEYSRYAVRVDPETYRYRGKVLSLIRDLGIPIIDVHELFARQPDPLSLFPLRMIGHYTPEGYRLIAQDIDSRLPPRRH